MEQLEFTRTDLVSFGNYLLSNERKELFESHPDLGSENLEERLSEVNHSDIENWNASK